jgi:superfamily I DNA/RNA helicase
VRGIPFVTFGGLKFLDSAHVKDVLACLRWAENPRDRVAGFRVLQLLPGIGPAKAGQILDQTGDTGGVAALAELRAPGGDRAEWSAFTDMTRGLSLRLADWPAKIEAVRRWYEPHLERIQDDAPARLSIRRIRGSTWERSTQGRSAPGSHRKPRRPSASKVSPQKVSYFFLGAGPVFGGMLAPSGGDLQAAETRFFTTVTAPS